MSKIMFNDQEYVGGGSGGGSQMALKDIESPEMHNTIYRGKDLTHVYNFSTVHERVLNGDFTDLYLGDYFTVEITTVLPDTGIVEETVDLMISAFNYYRNTVSKAPGNHLVLVPKRAFKTKSAFNKTNTTQNLYGGSHIHTTILPLYFESLNAALGGYLTKYNDNLTTGTFASPRSVLSSTGATLMTESQCFGGVLLGKVPYDPGASSRILPVFNFVSPACFGNDNFWLRSIYSSTNAVYCSSGDTSWELQASTEFGVRPTVVFA